MDFSATEKFLATVTKVMQKHGVSTPSALMKVGGETLSIEGVIPPEWFGLTLEDLGHHYVEAGFDLTKVSKCMAGREMDLNIKVQNLLSELYGLLDVEFFIINKLKIKVPSANLLRSTESFGFFKMFMEGDE